MQNRYEIYNNFVTFFYDANMRSEDTFLTRDHRGCEPSRVIIRMKIN